MTTSERKMLCLTRYFYIYDEVTYSLLISLVLKDNFDEILFWLSELIESGFIKELWQLTFKIYFDFYAIKYPKLGVYIRKQYILYKRSSKPVHLIRCYKNMRVKKVDTAVFHTRILSNQIIAGMNHTPSKEISLTMFRGRKPKYPMFNTHEIHCIQSILKNNMNNISYYYAKMNEKEFIDIIHRYLQYNRKQLPYRNEFYNDKKHIALCNMFSLQHKNEREIGRFISVNKEELELYNSYNKKVEPVYKTLTKHMKYAVKDEVSQFILQRDKIEYNELKELYWYKWEELCYYTPLWNERFKKYGASFITKDSNTQLVFENDKTREEFYEMYGYEFDEQGLDIQSKTLKQLSFKKGDVANITGKIIY